MIQHRFEDKSRQVKLIIWRKIQEFTKEEKFSIISTQHTCVPHMLKTEIKSQNNLLKFKISIHKKKRSFKNSI